MSKINVFSYNLRMDNPGDGINAFSKRKEYVLRTFPKSEDSAKSSSSSKNNVSPKKHFSQKNQKSYAKDSAKSFGKKKK